MSYFEDQEEDWLANDCKGHIEDYDGAGNYTPGFSSPVGEKKPKTEAQIARKKRKKARNKERDRQAKAE